MVIKVIEICLFISQKPKWLQNSNVNIKENISLKKHVN